MKLPTKRDEAWRFTDLSQIYTNSHSTTSEKESEIEEEEDDEQFSTTTKYTKDEMMNHISECLWDIADGQQMVFVDGKFNAELSNLSNLPEDILAGSVQELFGDNNDNGNKRSMPEDLYKTLLWQPEIGVRHTLAAGSLPFAALNQACLKDAACIVIPEKYHLEKPIQILNVGTHQGNNSPTISFPRLHVIGRRRSSSSIIQSYTSIGEGVHLCNAITTFMVELRAQLKHYYVQEGSFDENYQHIDAVNVNVRKASDYQNVIVNMGGNLGRINFEATMNGTLANVETEGLTVTGTRQYLDTHSYIHHTRKEATSNMYQCNIASDESHCVFRGRMKLEGSAQKVKADQLTRSIMLTDECTVDAMPTLEVCAEDVECTHGATIADIDDQDAFYLQSRGIPRTEAKALLMLAFARKVYDKLPDTKLQERIFQRLRAVTPDSDFRRDRDYSSI